MYTCERVYCKCSRPERLHPFHQHHHNILPWLCVYVCVYVRACVFSYCFFERKIQMSSSKSPTFVQLRENKLDSNKTCLLYLKRKKEVIIMKGSEKRRAKQKEKKSGAAPEPMRNLRRRLPIIWKKRMSHLFTLITARLAAGNSLPG